MNHTRSKPETEARIAYSYIRFSTPEQAKGDSQRRQINAGKKWCLENGYDHSEETFFDKGKSGFSGKTLQDGGELKRFLSLIEDGTIRPGSVLLVENFDRLSRLKPVQSYRLFLNLMAAGLGLVFTLSYDRRVITEELCNKESGLLQMILGECIRAHTESARKSQLVSESKRDKRSRIEQGEILRHNTVPKYFTWDSGTKTYVHGERVGLIRELVKDYLAGKSLYAIAQQMNRGGQKSIKKGGKWSSRSVKCILRNRALIGEYLGNPNFFKPIIEVEDFNRVQVLLDQRGIDRGRRAELLNIFKGVIFCICGQRMHVTAQTLDYRTKEKWKRLYRYFRCASVAQGTPCQHRYYAPTGVIELEFVIHVLMTDPRHIARSEVSEEIRMLRSEAVVYQEEISRHTTNITKLLSFKDGNLPMPEKELMDALASQEKLREQAKRSLDATNVRLLGAEQSPVDHQVVKAILAATEIDKGRWSDDHTVYQMSGADMDYDEMAARIEKLLADNEVRKKLQPHIPRLIGRIVVDSQNGNFEVFNHSRKSIYRSMLW